MGRYGSEEEYLAAFEERFSRVMSPVMLAIEDEVLGLDYGSVGWCTSVEAVVMAKALSLEPGDRLLELGSGTGWPAIQLAKLTGSKLILTDFAETGLQLACERARVESVDRVCARADGAELSFATGSVDGISHTDMMCCLSRKTDVLAECRRVLTDTGVMVFTAITRSESSTPDELVGYDAGPEYVESPRPYHHLLSDAGFSSVEADLSEEFLATAVLLLRSRERHYDGLVGLFGGEEADVIVSRTGNTMRAIEDGILQRHMYTANPSV